MSQLKRDFNSIANFYETHALSYDERVNVYAPPAGTVAFVRLFGSSPVFNPHLAMIFLDGVPVGRAGHHVREGAEMALIFPSPSLGYRSIAK